MPAQKNSVLAFILTLCFGPLGYLYVSVAWGLLWMLVYLFMFVITLGLAGALAPVMNVLLAIYAIFSVNRQNERSGVARPAPTVSREDGPFV